MRLNLFAHACGHHAAAWRAPGSSVSRLGDITYWEELARIAERGRLDALFLADGQSIAPAGAERGPTWFLEPITVLTAMARATERIGLVTTVSSTFSGPVPRRSPAGEPRPHLPRSGRDQRGHLDDRRRGSQPRHARAARSCEALRHRGGVHRGAPGAVGLMALPEHPGRSGGGVRRSVPAATATASRGVLPGRRAAERADAAAGPPGAVPGRGLRAGRELAARHAEGIYAEWAWDLESALAYRSDIRARAAALGRAPETIAVMPGLVVHVASTEEEARRMRADLDSRLPVADSLRQLSFFIGQDASDWELDATVPPLPPLEEFTGPKGRYATVLRIVDSVRPTVRELLGLLAAGGGHATVIGTPESVADEIERSVDAGARRPSTSCRPPSQAGSRTSSTRSCPCQRRGRFRREYEGAHTAGAPGSARG